MHFTCDVIEFTFGVGFTVIVKLLVGPVQLFAVGITENVPTTGELDVFANAILEILPLPLATIPIDI